LGFCGAAIAIHSGMPFWIARAGVVTSLIFTLISTARAQVACYELFNASTAPVYLSVPSDNARLTERRASEVSLDRTRTTPYTFSELAGRAFLNYGEPPFATRELTDFDYFFDLKAMPDGTLPQNPEQAINQRQQYQTLTLDTSILDEKWFSTHGPWDFFDAQTMIAYYGTPRERWLDSGLFDSVDVKEFLGEPTHVSSIHVGAIRPGTEFQTPMRQFGDGMGDFAPALYLAETRGHVHLVSNPLPVTAYGRPRLDMLYPWLTLAKHLNQPIALVIDEQGGYRVALPLFRSVLSGNDVFRQLSSQERLDTIQKLFSELKSLGNDPRFLYNRAQLVMRNSLDTGDLWALGFYLFTIGYTAQGTPTLVAPNFFTGVAAGNAYATGTLAEDRVTVRSLTTEQASLFANKRTTLMGLYKFWLLTEFTNLGEVQKFFDALAEAEQYEDWFELMSTVTFDLRALPNYGPRIDDPYSKLRPLEAFANLYEASSVLPVRPNGWKSQKALDKHFASHGGPELHLRDAAEYLQMATEFFNSKGDDIVMRRKGHDVYVKYDFETHEFGVIGVDGKIVTYYILDQKYHANLSAYLGENATGF